jgi:hypothetical protein
MMSQLTLVVEVAAVAAEVGSADADGDAEALPDALAVAPRGDW